MTAIYKILSVIAMITFCFSAVSSAEVPGEEFWKNPTKPPFKTFKESTSKTFQNEPTGWKGNPWGTKRSALVNTPTLSNEPMEEADSAWFNRLLGLKGLPVYQVQNNDSQAIIFCEDEIVAVVTSHTLETGMALGGALITKYGEPATTQQFGEEETLLFGWTGDITTIVFSISKEIEVSVLAFTSTEAMKKLAIKKKQKQPEWDDPRYYGPGKGLAKINDR